MLVLLDRRRLQVKVVVEHMVLVEMLVLALVVAAVPWQLVLVEVVQVVVESLLLDMQWLHQRQLKQLVVLFLMLMVRPFILSQHLEYSIIQSH